MNTFKSIALLLAATPALFATETNEYTDYTVDFNSPQVLATEIFSMEAPEATAAQHSCVAEYSALSSIDLEEQVEQRVMAKDNDTGKKVILVLSGILGIIGTLMD